MDSQLEALRGRASANGHELKSEHVFIDEGYSGSRLDRPALGRLRDVAREGEPRFDELARLSESRDDGRAAVQRWESQLQRLAREEQRLVDAYQAEVIDLEELKTRRDQIRGRREVLTTRRDQEQRLAAERHAAKAVWSDLEAFCRRVRSRLDEATLEERQRILQLLIERVKVGEDSLEIRHVIPLGCDRANAKDFGGNRTIFCLKGPSVPTTTEPEA